MNKSLRIISIIILVLLTILLTGIFIKLIKDGDFMGLRFWGRESTELIFNEEYEDIFDEISVYSTEGNIYIMRSENEKIKVVVYGKKEYSSINTDNNVLSVTGETKKCKFFCFNREYARIEVYLPSNYEKNIKIEGRTGDIKIDNFDSLNNEIITQTGDVTIENIKSSKIKTTTGDIRINKIENAEIKVTTGDINISEVNRLTLSTTTGDITINKINGYMNISTTTGDIDINNVELLENSNINVTTGDITIGNTNEFYIDAHSKTGDVKINNNYRTAELELKISATTGDIRISN